MTVMQLDLFEAVTASSERIPEQARGALSSWSVDFARDPEALGWSTAGTANPEPKNPNPEPLLVFVRHARARRYVIRVIGDGTVRVTIPRWGSKREAAAFAGQERAWIEKQRRRIEQNRLLPNPELRAPDAAPGTRNPEPDVLARAKRELPARLFELAAEHRLTVARVSVRNQRSRWGSCSRSGHICLNWRLVDVPDWIRDYVIIHELMHLKRMDHSRRFWKLVAQACPAYQDARRWLRQQHLAPDASNLPT